MIEEDTVTKGDTTTRMTTCANKRTLPLLLNSWHRLRTSNSLRRKHTKLKIRNPCNHHIRQLRNTLKTSNACTNYEQNSS